MRHDQDRSPLGCDLAYFAQTLPLELRVTDGKYLVYEKDLGLEVRCDGERETHVHAARIPLDGRVKEALNAGEVDDGVELPVNLRLAHTEDRAVEVDVLTTRELGMESRAHLEQRADTPVQTNFSLRRS